MVQPPLIGSASTSQLHDPETLRRLRSYGRKRKGGLDIEIKYKSTRATKKSTVLRSAEYILPAHVTVSLYDKNVAAYEIVTSEPCNIITLLLPNIMFIEFNEIVWLP
nr:uncharacterized protein LOC113711546 [Coffea arabica]